MSDEEVTENAARQSAVSPGSPGSSGKRRRLVIAGAVAAAILVLVVLPGYLALQPGFYGRYSGLSAQYKPWTTSTHAEVGCQSCHVPPTMLAQATYRVGMVGQAYWSLVSRSKEPSSFGTPTNDACLSCHYDLRTISPKGDLQIPHKAHVQILKMKCVDCHNYLVHQKSPEGRNTPRMAECLRCHNGDTADNACTACHTEKAAPATHRARDWTVVHSAKAAEPKAECKKCHGFTEKWCSDCHSRRPQSHSRDWRAAHGQKVKEHRNCEACHLPSFCIRCHGEVPGLNLNPTLKLVQ